MRKRSVMVLLLCILLVTPVLAAPKPKNMRVRALTPLSFGFVIQGQPAFTVDPLNPPFGASPAQLQVTGEPWMPFGIILPDFVTITSAQSALTVSNFMTDLENSQGVLDGLGGAVFLVGATLDPIPTTAREGTYSGRGTIGVYYLY